MFRKAKSQGSLLEVRHLLRHLVTKGSFYERLAEHGHEIVGDEDYAHFYSEGKGRPCIPPSIMVRAMLCATHDRASDAEASRRTRVDLDWKAAMGVEEGFGGIGATTFGLFRSRMVVHDADATAFEATLAKARDAGIFSKPLTTIIDSSPVRGAGAVHDTYELIRGFVAKVARAAGELPEDVAELVQPFLGGKPDIDWQDPDVRRAHLNELVAAARALLGAVEDSMDGAVTEPAALLAAVVDQDTEQGDDGNLQIRRGVAKDRIVSHSDPEMRHGRKSASRRFDGHKMHVLTDEESELVLAADVGPGNGGDAEMAVPVLTTAQAVPGVSVATLLADMAYSDGDLRAQVEELEATVVAKVPPVRNGGRFPKTDFSIDTGAGSVTCPAGVTTTESRPVKDHKRRPAMLFTFSASTCAACPLRDRCVKGSGGRSILVGVHEDRMAAARAAERDPGVRALLRRRSKVERKIDHLQDLGMGKARYRGRRKTKLQLLFAAAVANFSRLVVLGAFGSARAAPIAA